MSVDVRLDEDYHVHSVFSDDAVSTLAENVQAARERGLRTVCLAEHVRRDTATVGDFLAAVADLPPEPGLRVLTGVEAKILDHRGTLDVPDLPAGLDLVLIADHQFPGPDGPLHPNQVRTALAEGELAAADAVESLVESTAAALGQADRPLLVHLFSVLPKVGLAEYEVPDRLLGMLAGRARQAGAMVEVNEKWACPSARALRAFADAGVPIVASTDSHHCASVGVYDRVRQITGDAAAAAEPPWASC
ncbi:MAG TPA: PHP domain-containing protein [Streptosporangiaceae bacterium]